MYRYTYSACVPIFHVCDTNASYIGADARARARYSQYTCINGIHVCTVWNISCTWELDITPVPRDSNAYWIAITLFPITRSPSVYRISDSRIITNLSVALINVVQSLSRRISPPGSSRVTSDARKSDNRWYFRFILLRQSELFFPFIDI